MRWFLYVLIFLSVSSSLFAKKLTISFWHILGYHAKPIIEDMVEEYNKKLDGISNELNKLADTISKKEGE